MNNAQNLSLLSITDVDRHGLLVHTTICANISLISLRNLITN